MSKKALRKQINDALDSDVQRARPNGTGFTYTRVGTKPLLLEELEAVCAAFDLTPGLRATATRDTCRRTIRNHLGTADDDGAVGPLTEDELTQLRRQLREVGQ